MKKILFSLLLFFHCLHAAPTKILVGSPIRQKPAILQEFLDSLEELDQQNYILNFFFIDDNTDEESRFLLENFEARHPRECLIQRAENIDTSVEFICNELTHYWKEEIIWKVASFKDRMIDFARDNNYDYLFLIDSDLVLHPLTLDQLINSGKEVISNIFWTRWQPDTIELPQVWLKDEYLQFEVKPGENISPEEAGIRFWNFIGTLRTPGIYEVGGLGACTLIHRSALEKGVSFKQVKRLSFWGEDRHFCIRAAALGIPLYVDTHLPSYHIYRESALCGVQGFKETYEKKTRVTLSMIVRNEADKYLREVLESAKEYITDAVITDDASTDNTPELIEEILHDIPLKLIRNPVSLFSNEVILRKAQWDAVVETNPDWILHLDADQILEKRAKEEIPRLIQDQNCKIYYFRIYDFWNETQYRDDLYWGAHRHHYPFLVKYVPDFPYEWRETPQHCGHFPINVTLLEGKCSDLRVKHFGWATQEDRMAKYMRYLDLDPDAEYGWKEQYESILDPNPNLVTWIE